MSVTGLEVFDRTTQSSVIWVDDVMRDLNWDDRHKAYRALRSVLHALRDRLPVNDAAHLAAQLPMLIRGLFFEGWQPAKVPIRGRNEKFFLAQIGDDFLFEAETDPRQIATAVFGVIERHITGGQVDQIKRVLPRGIQELWP